MINPTLIALSGVVLQLWGRSRTPGRLQRHAFLWAEAALVIASALHGELLMCAMETIGWFGCALNFIPDKRVPDICKRNLVLSCASIVLTIFAYYTGLPNGIVWVGIIGLVSLSVGFALPSDGWQAIGAGLLAVYCMPQVWEGVEFSVVFCVFNGTFSLMAFRAWRAS